MAWSIVELDVRAAALLTILSGILLICDFKISGLVILWLAIALLLWGWLRSLTIHLLAHWRTALLLPGDVSCAIALTVKLVSDDLTDIATLQMGIILLLISIFSSVTLFVFPVPNKVFLSGTYQRIGTISFNITMELPTTAQLHHEKLIYDLPVQCWFPLVRRGLLYEWTEAMWPTGSAIWTSGDPVDQVYLRELNVAIYHDCPSLPRTTNQEPCWTHLRQIFLCLPSSYNIFGWLEQMQYFRQLL